MERKAIVIDTMLRVIMRELLRELLLLPRADDPIRRRVTSRVRDRPFVSEFKEKPNLLQGVMPKRRKKKIRKENQHIFLLHMLRAAPC